MTVLSIHDIYKSFSRKSELRWNIRDLFAKDKQKVLSRSRAVLKGVSFELGKGDVLGIMGRNGCGKSTLLQIIGGIYVPDKGSVDTKGSISYLPAMSGGINPKLSMRENIWLSGILRGLPKKIISDCFDEIVAFSELDDFLDVEVSHFSSGMSARLAFATTVFFTLAQNSDILLLDEVFGGGGDKTFKDKALVKFEEFFKREMSIIFVSHNSALIEKYCTKAFVLDKGRIDLLGNPPDIVRRYEDLCTNASSQNKMLA